MKRLYSELTEEAKESYGITEDLSDDSSLYCTECGRAMMQGDCVVSEEEGALRCAFDDCAPEGNRAFQSLYGWDAYREDLRRETAHWPEKPEPGKRYERKRSDS